MHAFTMSFYNIYADACSIRSIQYVQSSNMNGHSKHTCFRLDSFFATQVLQLMSALTMQLYK